jgi:hypothetical protein
MNHLSDQVDRAGRLKRGGDKEFAELDAEEAEERYRVEPVECLATEIDEKVHALCDALLASEGQLSP